MDIGQRFGSLVVSGEAEKFGKRWFCECKCDCGSVTLRRTDQLKSFSSCGCVRSEKARKQMSARLRDLSGMRFVRLVAVRRVECDGRRTKWRCVCDCGTVVVIDSSNLTSGNTCSCGCARRDKATVRSAVLRAWKSEYERTRRSTSVVVALDARIRSAVCKSLKRNGNRKNNALTKILGYSICDLKARLQKTMPKGFSWEDFLRGDLHVDHITPLSVFNVLLDTDLDFKRAWALTNLQLLPARENIQKSDKLAGPFQPSLSF